MIQMRRKFLIPMPAGRDMKVPLDLIPLQAPINATRIGLLAPPHARALGELLPGVAPDLAQNMMHMRVGLLLRESCAILLAQRLVLVQPIRRLVVALIHPQRPAGIVFLQEFTGEDAVARGVLDVDAQHVARHLHDHVEVELEVARHALFHAEVVVFGSLEPGAEFRDREERADEEDEDGPLAAATGGGRVGGFGFGCLE